MKKLTLEDLKTLRDRLRIPITDEQLDGQPVPAALLQPGRGQRGHPAPARASGASSAARCPSAGAPTAKSLALPDDAAYDGVKRGSGKQPIATTMAFVRLLKDLMRDKEFGARVVPIIPDEARTFGMDSFFPTAKIYNPHGQTYTSVDRDLMLAYKESTSGPDPARGHQRGRLAGRVHRGRFVVRHARRADDPDLHLLLDVRLPAHRRRPLGGRRPDVPRLPHRAPPPGAPP